LLYRKSHFYTNLKFSKTFSDKKQNNRFQESNEEDTLYKKYNAVFKLNSRRIVSVTGEDAESFLQSMITNDMKTLKDNKVALFSLFLNPKGRIMFDSIIVKSHL
jgi:folate-binding Fe-S cluster repair protein YgfZ